LRFIDLLASLTSLSDQLQILELTPYCDNQTSKQCLLAKNMSIIRSKRCYEIHSSAQITTPTRLQHFCKHKNLGLCH